VTAIAPDPFDPQTAYVGTAQGGVWKTTDGGGTWSPLFDQEPSLAIGAVATDPSTLGTVYAGTGEANRSIDAYAGLGLFKSTDGGAGWAKIGGNQFDGCYFADVAVKGDDPNVLLAAPTSIQGRYNKTCPSAGVFRSTDGGSTWTRVLSGIPYDLAADPGDPSTWLAGLGSSKNSSLNGVFRSTDGGVHWSLVTSGLPQPGFTPYGRVALASGSDGQHWYAAIANDITQQLVGLYSSTNGGTRWKKMTAPTGLCSTQCGYDLVVAADPADPTTAYVGGTALYTYPAGSSKSTRIGYGDNGIHVGIHALSFDVDGALWVGTDGGAYRTADEGATFANLNNGLSILLFNQGAVGTADRFVAGTQGTGTLDSSNGTWTGLEIGDGGFSAIDPTDPSTVYVTSSPGWIQSNDVAEKTTDRGTSFTVVFPPLGQKYPGQYIAPLAMDPADPNTLLYGANQVFETTNGGGSWRSISQTFGSCPTTGKPTGCVTAIASAPGDRSTVYAGTHTGQMFVTRNRGATRWIDTGPNGLDGKYVTSIEVSPADPTNAYASVAGFGTAHLYETDDAGGSWNSVSGTGSGSLPDAPVDAIQVDWTADPPVLYAGTDVGPYSSTDGGGTWAPVGTGIPAIPVMALILDQQAGRLIALTHGRGAYSLDLTG
jgi:photosystem II stability/assembly factor-like uncharacterized protein